MMDASRLLETEIDEQAALWFSRSQGRRLTDAEQRQFQEWLQRSAAHAEAFRQMQQIWGDCALIARPASAAQPKVKPSWWRPLRGCAAGAFFLLALWLPASQLPLVLMQDIHLQTDNYAREVVLSDGSRVHLNRYTKMRVHYAKEKRQLWLDRGEVYLQVAENKQRPFLVYAGESQVRVVGTEFDVRYDAEEMGVAVRQGIVAVTGRSSMETVMLHAGDSARLRKGENDLQRGQRQADEVGEWRSGQISFRNRPLGELLKEVARYRSGKIELIDERLGSLPVSGSLDLAHPDEFLNALPLLLAVNVVQDDQGNVLILPRPQQK
ncbi:FecR domain-containing protein [Yersinia nurmii]|uniref:FecR domain-containing protein n=1 Tax=Yersinia nurmii TaxID=685706 RepID=A0AAW7K3G1_9GAMM|nr:FecR domain-containing protein [Yersinia nurmii]MDN0089359.1 FecR domain-containing protein [Yersinia nurmii]CNE75466.1 putative two-component system sensor protein [Yersinia nurmii]